MIEEKCKICNGMGRVLVIDKTTSPPTSHWQMCWKCFGKGRVPAGKK